jgi:hypothetical protein
MLLYVTDTCRHSQALCTLRFSTKYSAANWNNIQIQTCINYLYNYR